MEVREWWMVVDIEGEVPGVLDSKRLATGDDGRQVLRRMGTAFAGVHARSVEHHGVVQHAVRTVLRGLEEGEESIEAIQVESIDLGELFQHAGIAAVV